MPYLNVDDGMDEHPKVEALSDAAFRLLFRDLFAWSQTGVLPRHPVALEMIATKRVRRAPRWWLPESIRPLLRHRARISTELRAAVYVRDGWKCLACGSPEDLTLDHIHPWSLGGPDTFDNLQTLCRSCNSSKGARIHGPLD